MPDATDARIDYRLRRAAVLRALAVGARTVDEVCDAPTELRRAAAALGAPRREPCPVCEAAALSTVTYVFDPTDRARPGGRAVRAADVAPLAERRGVVAVYEVEVCRGCGWHHALSATRVRGAVAATDGHRDAGRA